MNAIYSIWNCEVYFKCQIHLDLKFIVSFAITFEPSIIYLATIKMFKFFEIYCLQLIKLVEQMTQRDLSLVFKSRGTKHSQIHF